MILTFIFDCDFNDGMMAMITRVIIMAIIPSLKSQFQLHNRLAVQNSHIEKIIIRHRRIGVAQLPADRYHLSAVVRAVVEQVLDKLVARQCALYPGRFQVNFFEQVGFVQAGN